MGRKMTAAAQVRRAFRLGRPAKSAELFPLHPTIVWQRATAALADFRERMAAADLDPMQTTAEVVYITTTVPDEPATLSIEGVGLSGEQHRAKLYERLIGEDVIAIGMVFTQQDEEAGTVTRFPHQFAALDERSFTALKAAAQFGAFTDSRNAAETK